MTRVYAKKGANQGEKVNRHSYFGKEDYCRPTQKDAPIKCNGFGTFCSILLRFLEKDCNFQAFPEPQSTP